MVSDLNKGLLCVLCIVLLVQSAAAGGIFDFLFGPPAEQAPATTPSVSGPAPAVPTDISGVITLLQNILASVTRIEQKLPEGTGVIQTGNIMLFDNSGNSGANADQASAVVALPPGKCDIGVYGQNKLYISIEEMKDYASDKYTRNKQVCIDSFLCRKTVQLDADYPFLYIYFRDTNDQQSLVDRVFLAYRCSATGS